MSDSDKKKLCDLKVVDLRSELEKRGLERTGVKQVLSDRLSKALVDEGKDPETYLFDSNETDGKGSGDKPVDKEAEGKEPEKIEEDGAEQNNAEEANDGNDKLDGHESPIRLTLEDDEAIQDVDNDKAGEKDASNDTKKDDAATQDETKAKSVEKGEKDTGDGTSSAKTGDNKLQKKVAKSNPNVLWISNVAQNTRASELKAALTACGKVLGAKVVVNAKFPGSCCFGYVTMGSVEDVDNVILKLNNTELNGQIIKIDKFDLVRAEQMKNIGGGKEGDNKSDGKDAEKSNGEKGKGEHRSRSRQTSSSRKDSRTKSVSSRDEGRKGSKERRSRSRGRREQDLLTFEKIKAEREQQRIREKRRQIREEARHLREEDIRRKEAQRRQRIERERLEREKEKLRMEREKIERERAELVRMERERQRLEREKIAMEKMELERTLLRLGEERKAVKRPAQYSRDDGYDNRKRSATDRHFAPPPPPSSSKRDSHYPDKRGADYQSARPSITSRPGSGVIGGSRVYDGRDSRGTRPDIAPMSRSKDARYERDDRSTHYRSSAREERRPIPETKSNIPITERLGRYENSDQSARFDRNVNLWQPPSSKPSFQSGGGGMGQKSWQKDQWRQEPAMTDRWQSSQVAPSRVFGGVSNSSGSICPPPPGMTSYPDNRFNTGMRKY